MTTDQGSCLWKYWSFSCLIVSLSSANSKPGPGYSSSSESKYSRSSTRIRNLPFYFLSFQAPKAVSLVETSGDCLSKTSWGLITPDNTLFTETQNINQVSILLPVEEKNHSMCRYCILSMIRTQLLRTFICWRLIFFFPFSFLFHVVAFLLTAFASARSLLPALLICIRYEMLDLCAGFVNSEPPIHYPVAVQNH